MLALFILNVIFVFNQIFIKQTSMRNDKNKQSTPKSENTPKELFSIREISEADISALTDLHYFISVNLLRLQFLLPPALLKFNIVWTAVLFFLDPILRDNRMREKQLLKSINRVHCRTIFVWWNGSEYGWNDRDYQVKYDWIQLNAKSYL